MAKCSFCRLEMQDGVSCKITHYYLDGGPYTRIPYGGDDSPPNCHDCKTPKGGLHHPGCDVERCPRCKGQAISCSCTMEDEAT